MVKFQLYELRRRILHPCLKFKPRRRPAPIYRKLYSQILILFYLSEPFLRHLRKVTKHPKSVFVNNLSVNLSSHEQPKPRRLHDGK